MITISDIQRAVADHYGIPTGTMREPRPVGRRAQRNTFAVSHPRQIAMVLAFRLTDHGKRRIGQLFGGRDHSTVIHAIRSVDKRAKKNPNLHTAMRRVTLDLVRH